MISNAILFQSEIQQKFCEIWYDPKYQYYFSSPYRWMYETGNSTYESSRREFVSLDSARNVLGCIGYVFDPVVGLAHRFGAINFSEDKLTFGRDLLTVVDDIFIKFGMETLEFSVVRGNPIERNYDRLVEKAGGRILCVRHARAVDLQGNMCDDKLYEITRNEYLQAMQLRKEARR